MLKSLTKVGNSHAILLDKVIMDLLGIDAGSRVNLTVDGGSLVITPVEPAADNAKFKAASERAEKKFDKLLTRLA
ncbi:MAG: AbrB/MazE/SpoVT family DNA-binding domain-containing protein [Phycisphaerae bacterium]|nr:AbrB/MazE/SpoVT family DNA-binding domain-containing protein [Phycisphaerae bacterium]